MDIGTGHFSKEIFCLWISTGISISTVPGRPEEAMAKAFGMASNNSLGDFIKMLCFVIGRERPKVSASWKASVPTNWLATCPVMATNGMESAFASARAVRRFITPGPLVAKQTAGFSVERAIPSARKPAACSWRTKT